MVISENGKIVIALFIIQPFNSNFQISEFYVYRVILIFGHFGVFLIWKIEL